MVRGEKEGCVMVNVKREERWWASQWAGGDELEAGGDELEDEVASSPSLWEAEVAALSDEQLAAFEDTSEDP
jgi:hypothetical protein